MRASTRAWTGSAIFLIVAPGVVAGLIPWLITRWDVADWGILNGFIAAAALILIIGGIWFLLHSFARFAGEGEGTPSPLSPTEHLVVGGVYRYVRNPMYLSVVAILLGQCLLFASWMLVVYTVVAIVAVVLFVRFYEEPTLARVYGAEYDRYRKNVPGWFPRGTPWHS
ncbi:isoprenylcysteine carboxylmethyltransferase family protein [Diaminobutyricimonas sp. TR449]|uniref:methyltransferase family protein n=1 Tax=Diaminobutyricimonas sp. TR449 TaxID=2708076 RepID=UPI0014219CD2|nr:isoprenylcysteine carboxylmethyltransferase family protein [Diaminobutyricimonas sp. TR449]